MRSRPLAKLYVFTYITYLSENLWGFIGLSKIWVWPCWWLLMLEFFFSTFTSVSSIFHCTYLIYQLSTGIFDFFPVAVCDLLAQPNREHVNGNSLVTRKAATTKSKKIQMKGSWYKQRVKLSFPRKKLLGCIFRSLSMSTTTLFSLNSSIKTNTKQDM